MTIAQLIDGILDREQGYQDNPADKGNAHGGATNWGITSASWGTYRRLGRPATRAEIWAITRTQAVEFYRSQYVASSPFTAVAYEPLRVQLIDFGINSSNERATRWLQRVLDVPVTGSIDDRTTLALQRDRGDLVNRALVGARLQMYHMIAASDATQKAFLGGWLARAVSFLDPVA